MKIQLPEFDFTGSSLHAENNRESQNHLEANSDHFDNQIQTVLRLLQSGVRVTQDMVYGEPYYIKHLPRRIGDIRHILKIEVKDRWLPGRVKEYFI